MKNCNDTTAVFKVRAWPAIYITIVTWLPLLWALIPALYYGEISEKSMGPGTPGGRFDVSPQAFFIIMVLCTTVFFFISFLPLILCFIRGYFVKFSEDMICFKGKKFNIEDIDKIELSTFFGQDFTFILNNGQRIFMSSGLNRNIAEYIKSRFHKKVIG